MTVLDVGCGPGTITIDFARLVPQGHVTGVEYVSDPLDKARSLAIAQDVTNVKFEVADIHSLPYEDNSFDIVHAHQVLQHIADPVKGLSEMRRVVKIGGIVACRESAEMSWYPPSKGLRAWKEVTGRLAEKRGGNPHPGNHIHVWARKAGFDRIQKSAGSWCFASDEEREYWGGSMAERMMNSGLRNMAIEDGIANEDDFSSIAEGWNDFKSDQDAWFGLMHGQIICTK